MFGKWVGSKTTCRFVRPQIWRLIMMFPINIATSYQNKLGYPRFSDRHMSCMLTRPRALDKLQPLDPWRKPQVLFGQTRGSDRLITVDRIQMNSASDHEINRTTCRMIKMAVIRFWFWVPACETALCSWRSWLNLPTAWGLLLWWLNGWTGWGSLKDLSTIWRSLSCMEN